MLKRQWNHFLQQKQEAERSGMGFSFMEAFMDSLEVESTPGKGTLVKMSKIIGKEGKYGPHNRSDSEIPRRR